jgi:DNA-binding NtrC family response regulator
VAPRKLQIELDLPEDLLEFLGPESVASQKAKEALVMQLLRRGKLDQSRAAEILDISRAELFELMAEYQVSVTDATREELERGLANLGEALK